MNKIAIVTGGRRGIGLAVSKALLREGYKVLVAATVSREDAAPLLCELGENADYFRCDISSGEDRSALLAYAKEKYGSVNLLVNNAGTACKKRLDILETTEESFDSLINTNLKGTFFMCQGFANYMKELKTANPDFEARIINISSISAYTSSVSRGEYCISKAGISMVTKLFADRLAECGIYVFEVRPGIILTDMTSSVKDKYEKLISEGVTPIRRFGTPEDVAKAVVGISGGFFDFGTGTVFNADGGFSVRRL